MVPCGASGVTASPTAKGAATSRPTRSARHPAARPAAAGPPTSPPARRTPGGRSRPITGFPVRTAAEQGVAGRVLAADELHDVDAVALEPQQRGAQAVGEGVGEPLAQDAVPGEHRVRRGRGRLAELGGDVVVAARRGQDQRRAPLDGSRQRVVGGGVAGVQGEDHVGRTSAARRPSIEAATKVASTPSSRAICSLCVARLLALVDAGQVHRQAAHVGEVALGDEGQVGVAAAEVDDLRAARSARRACAGGPCRGRRRSRRRGSGGTPRPGGTCSAGSASSGPRGR